MEYKESLHLAGGIQDELRSFQRVGARVCSSIYAQVWGRMDRFWTHEQGQKTRESREIFPREGIGVMDNVGLLFQGPRGILGAFSGLQIAQD